MLVVMLQRWLQIVIVYNTPKTIYSRDAVVVSVFFAPANYGVIKIVYSSSEVVLQTTKHTMIYPGLGPSLKVIVLHPVI
jgi:hypothetical protein